jgi:dienelactone hydrolase
MESVVPRPLAVTAGSRRVPAVMWAARGRGPAPLVLLGHGGSGHKTAPRQQLLADLLAAAGVCVVAIDGPLHGERAPRPMAPGDYQADLVARGVDVVVREMVEDWTAALAAARATGAVDSRLGYLGMSMGARFGLPLGAALGDQLDCAVLGKLGVMQSEALHPGLHDAKQLRACAADVVAPTLWHVAWDDELFARAGQLELFDSVGTVDKQILGFPGRHGTTPPAAVDAWVGFLLRHLLDGPGFELRDGAVVRLMAEEDVDCPL